MDLVNSMFLRFYKKSWGRHHYNLSNKILLLPFKVNAMTGTLQ